MTGRATALPVLMVLVIASLTVVAIMMGRSNAPDVSGDNSYPHFVCTFNDYCAGSSCTREAGSFVIYLAHADGQPRVEMTGFGTRAQMVETDGLRTFTSEGGQVSGTFQVFDDGALRLEGQSVGNDAVVEHYGVGSCERLHTP